MKSHRPSILHPLTAAGQNLVRRIFHAGLTRALLLWFLLLALLPLMLVSWFSYQQSQATSYAGAAHAMTQRAALQSRFIKNWFDYHFLDLQQQAENQGNVRFLQQLVQALQASGKGLPEFVGSYQWARIVEANKMDLVNLSRIYGDYYDVFLIDKQGNILFNLTKEADLGTNLLTGPYKESRFAQAVVQSLESGQALFSDLEHYAPSENTIAGFLTAPLLDDSGNKIGVFAIQIDVEKINELMTDRTGVAAAGTSYLVGSDLLLRSAISGQPDSRVLRTHINTEQTQLWQQEHGDHELLDGEHETAFSYLGPAAQRVLGTHHSISIGNVHWGLIAEMDERQALAPARRLAQLTGLLLVMVLMVVLLLAVIVANRLVQPLRRLLEASQQVAQGHLNQKVVISSNNEIGQLAEAFNQMLSSRQSYEVALQTSMQQSEQALEDLAEQKFVLDQHSIVAITDVNGDITFVNKKFIENSGYSHDELIGQNHRLLNSGHHPLDFFRDMYRVISSGEVWHGEVCNKAKDGHLYWLDSTIVPFLGADGKPKNYIAIRTDITARVKAEKELCDAMDVAQDAVRQKSEFLANMSHEIRTPMNGVIGMTGLLLDTQLTAQQNTYAETIMTSADALLTIINDILDFSKIEAGKMELEEVTFDLQNLAEDVAELMAVRCRDKKFEMLLHYKLDTPRFVIGDPGRIRQVMLNLLSNAIKFTEQGFILLTVQADERVNGKTAFSIAVQDTGIGIDKDKQDLIFNQFDQADGSTTRKFGGTGLGLSISRQLSEMMGGGLKIESQPGEGSTFTSILRLQENAKQESLRVPMLEDYGVFKGLNMLIVDDIETARIILKEQVAELGMNTEMAISGEEALQKLTQAVTQNKPFDIVIVDFHMPGMDGEMLEEKIFNSQEINDPVQIFVTSSPQRGDTRRLKSLGFDGYLTKPTRTGEIAKILAVIWAARQTGEDISLVTRHTIQESRIQTCKNTSFANIHILLAEDNPINQMVATEMLEAFGCKVTPAGNGLEALQLVKQREFDLIFMDCQMPEMDGFEATQRVREYEHSISERKTPIIAFTANAMQGDKEKCLAAGMDDYISKPVNKEGLDRVIAKWLPDKIAMEPPLEDQAEDTCPDDSPAAQSEGQQDVLLDLAVFDDLKKLFGEKFEEAFAQQNVIARKNIGRAQQAVQDKDIDTLERVMHSLKSSCRQFGAMHLGGLAEIIEAQAKANNMAEAAVLMSNFMRVHEQTEQLMSQHSEIELQILLVWNRSEALERMGGKPERLVMLIRMFIDNMPQQVNSLQHAIDQQQTDAAAIHAHTIKGVVGNIGGKQLQELAGRMEEAANSGDSDELKTLWPEFFQNYQQLIDVLQQEKSVQTTEPVSPPDTGTSVDCATLGEQLRELMLNLQQGYYIDPQTITDLQPLLATDQQEKLIQLNEQVSRFDTDLAITTLLEIASGQQISLSVVDGDSRRSESQG